MSVRTEIMGIATLKTILYKSELIVPYIMENDKTPIWDGQLYFYSKPNKGYQNKNDDLVNTIPIQVKAIKVNKFGKDTIKHSCDRKIMSVFKRNGGIIYFVVQIDDKGSKVYQTSLLPYDINNLLDTSNESNVKFDLKHLDDTMITSFEDECENFILHREMQYGTIEYKLPIENISEVIIRGSTRHSTIEDYLLNNELYIYGKRSKMDIIPFIVGKGIVNKIERVIEKNVIINGDKFYECFKIQKSKDEQRLIFDGALEIIMRGGELTINYKLHNEFAKVLNNTGFLASLLENKYFCADEVKFNLTIKAKKQCDLDKINNSYKYLKDIAALLDVFEIEHNALNIGGIKKEEIRYLNILIDAMVYGKQVQLNIDKPSVYRFDISNISFLTFIEPVGDNINNIVDFAKLQNKQFYLSVENDGAEIKSYHVTPYIMVNSENMIKANNIKPHKIKEAVLEKGYDKHISNSIVLLLLEMIKAYDKSLNKKYLKEALEVCLWLKKNNPEDPVHIINEYQIYFRERALLEEEKNVLQEMISKHSDFDNYDQLLCSIYLLLEDNRLFTKCFSLLPQDKKVVFINYPIYSLARK